MNLKDKRARRITAACASAAVVTAGGVAFGVAASANTPLTFNPGNSATITNLDPTDVGGLNAAMTYGLKVNGVTGADPVFVKIDSAPSTASKLWYERKASNGAPTAAGWAAATQAAPANTALTNASGDVLYLGADSAGTYNLRVFQDHNGNGLLDTGDDSTGTFTLNVKDVTGTSPTSDDLTFSLNAPSSIDKGRPATASIDSIGLSTEDIRGLNGATGVNLLGEAIAANFRFTVSGSSGDDGNKTPTFDGSKIVYKTTNPVVAAGPVSISAQLKTTNVPALYPASVTPAQITVNNNTVASTALDITGQTDNVKLAAGAATVRVGTSSVTYTVTAKNATPLPVEHATVWVKLGNLGGALTDVNQLSVPGKTVTRLSAGLAEFPVVTDHDGKATFTVTSTKTTSGAKYDVTADSNGIGSPGVVTATYTTAAATTVNYGNYGQQLGTKVTLTAKILDQWGKPFTPAGTSPQALLQVDGNDNGTYSQAGTDDYDTYVNIYDGGMTATVNDVSITTTHAFRYKWIVPGYGGAVKTGIIKWLASPAPGSVSLDSLTVPAGGATTALPLPAATVLAAPDVSAAPAGQSHTLVGTVKDSSSGAVLPYASFTLSGSTGVYFWDVDNAAWVSTLSARTDVNGLLQAKGDQSGSSVEVLFTRSGSNTVTVNAGGKTDTETFTVAKPGKPQAFTLNVTSQSTMPNTTVVVSGRVNDVFGNPIEGAGVVKVTADDITYGVFGTTSALDTNGSGDYSVSYAVGSKTGKVFLSAALQNALPSVDAGWAKIDGLSLTTKNATATGNVTIAADAVSLKVSKTTLVGGGNVTLTGNTRHNVPVDVYWKTTGGPAQFIDSVTSDGNGDFSVPATVTASGYFFAKTSTATSQAVTVKVVSTAKISARNLGRGWVRVSVSGGPSKSGTVVLWERLRGGKLVKKAVVHTNTGAASWKIKTTKGSHIYRATYTSNGAAISGVVSASIIL